MQPLNELPRRFGLTEEKGIFPFSYNKIENWGLVKKNPPDFSYFVNNFKDNAATIQAKKQWYDQVKCQEPYYSFNQECMTYCKSDVSVLAQSILKYLKQSFTFQDLLVKRYGPSPCLKPNSMSYFHLFTDQTTVGSYR